MPVATFQTVLEKAKAGATVIFQELPHDVPGLYNLQARRQQLQELIGTLSWNDAGNGVQEIKTGAGSLLLSADIQKALDYKKIERESLVDTGLKFSRREVKGHKTYYLVNHTAAPIAGKIPLNTEARSVLILDPQDGRQGWADAFVENGKTMVKIDLAPGEALILQTAAQTIDQIPAWPYLEKAGNPVPIVGNWQLQFEEGGPELPAPHPLDKLVSWTELADSKAGYFSGTATYTTTFNLSEKTADDYLLELGDVRESARVWVNGEEVGILWSVPFQAKIGKYLKQGENTLKVVVTNLMANRIRYLDQQGVEWRKYHEINFVNLEYQPFDASGWEPQPSGLLGPVTLQPLEANHE